MSKTKRKPKSRTLEQRAEEMGETLFKRFHDAEMSASHLIELNERVIKELQIALHASSEDRKEAMNLLKDIVKAGIIQPIRSKDFALLKNAQLFTLQYIGECRRRHGRGTHTK